MKLIVYIGKASYATVEGRRELEIDGKTKTLVLSKKDQEIMCCVGAFGRLHENMVSSIVELIIKEVFQGKKVKLSILVLVNHGILSDLYYEYTGEMTHGTLVLDEPKSHTVAELSKDLNCIKKHCTTDLVKSNVKMKNHTLS